MKNIFTGGRKNIIADGATGTYFSFLTGLPSSCCEEANISNPGIIKRMHKEYIRAGARLIRTNTFSANTAACRKSLDEVLEIIRAGYMLAVESVNEIKEELNITEEIFIAANTGPIYYEHKNNENLPEEQVIAEYKKIADTFLDLGASLFIFETFAETRYVNEISSYIKGQRPEAQIIASFAFTPDGYSRKGIYIEKIIEELDNSIDIFGMNCGCGPTHMDQLLNNVVEKVKARNMAISCMPNAGYASIENNRTIYQSSPEYFAEIVASMAAKGAFITGGCCGTTPEHIARLHERINSKAVASSRQKISSRPARERKGSKDIIASNFSRKIRDREFVILVELTPPSSSDLSELVKGSARYRDCGVDVVTISDSPLGRVKMDSIVASAKISREAGIETLPHLCCRDRNVNALRSAVIGAHAEGIRAILAVTGDAVPESERPYVKPVFNVSSSKLMQIIKEMNENLFKGDEFIIGGALNPFAVNKTSEFRRTLQKIENGCSFFLTQPVFDSSDLSLVKEVRKHARVLAGIMPLVSYRNAYYLKNEVPGFVLPDKIVNSFSPDMPREKAVETGIRIAVELAGKIREYADGFYLVTPFNRWDIICSLLERLREEKII